MSDVAVRVENLSKRYRIGERERYYTLRDTLARAFTVPFRWLRNGREQTLNSGSPRSTSISQSAIRNSPFIWALKDVSFEVKQGEVVGIIGRNGAGKSTLLKILSRITEPTEGEARIYGRVGSLLEVGTGFHSELTGRENIYLNGAILGMKKVEIDRKFDEIVAFAEVEKFLDTPVKHYSSGMYMRLAFSVAAHLEPEILLVDEVLAVGDAAFQKKCLGKMGEVARGGRTVLFVSHNMGTINSLTTNCIYLKGGQIAANDKTQEVVERYLVDTLDYKSGTVTDIEFYRRELSGESPVRVIRVSVNGVSNELPTLEIGSVFTVTLELEIRREIQGANLSLVLKNVQGYHVAVFFSWDQDFSFSLRRGSHLIELRVDDLPVPPGQYFADIGINQSTQTKAYDVLLDFPLFKVINSGKVLHWLERPWGGRALEQGGMETGRFMNAGVFSSVQAESKGHDSA